MSSGLNHQHSWRHQGVQVRYFDVFPQIGAIPQMTLVRGTAAEVVGWSEIRRESCGQNRCQSWLERSHIGRYTAT